MKNRTRLKLKKQRYTSRKVLRIQRKRFIRMQIYNGLRCRKSGNYSNITATTKVLRFLDSKKFLKNAQVSKVVTIRIPERFSFLENPDEAIHLLRKICYIGTHKSIKRLYFDHSKCKSLGICASTVMDIILIEMKKSYKRMNKSVPYGGTIPENGEVRDILEVSGILKHLGFRVPVKSHIRKLDLIRGNDRKSKSGDVATRVAEFFVESLKTQSFSLDKTGRQMLCEIVGEVIDNCENHGGEDIEWFTIGHYNRVEGKPYGECQLVIFNIGNTIFESLKLPTTSAEITKSLDLLTSKHKGFFNFTWTEESLWTLYALQEGISRFRNSLTDPDRGTGTVKLIDCFQSIGKTKDGNNPLMCITSGHTHILFDQEYILENKEFDGEQRQVIAFNQDNDLNHPPDKRNVQILKNFFPGTLISMKFYLDKAYLTEKMEENGNGN